MTIQLPEIVSAYFHAANARDTDAILRCFSAEATVLDERKEYRGLEEIREWKEDVQKKYAVTATPTSLQSIRGESRVTADVAGNFPGSPATLYIERL
jgi:ketosteroid isomerase-like protein